MNTISVEHQDTIGLTREERDEVCNLINGVLRLIDPVYKEMLYEVPIVKTHGIDGLINHSDPLYSIALMCLLHINPPTWCKRFKYIHEYLDTQ
jgi:hypothetical protein